ncbi:MAG: hypothetical protein IDH49_01810 [Gammaproteobacteria bacterium]|nr:hypothetical protein [Gammaproteobacteria bacterium]
MQVKTVTAEKHSSRRPHWSFYAFIPGVTLLLFLDSAWLHERGLDGQWVADVLTILYFALMIRTLDDPPLCRMMWMAVFISAICEIIGSMVMEVWIYRNAYVPLYVPFGHAIVIGSGFQMLRFAWTERHRRAIIAVGCAVYSGLIAAAFALWGDTFSVALGLFLAAVLLHGRNRLLYMFMPLPVLFVELVGTAFGCWYWPAAPFGVLATTNPPVGSIALYVILDMVVLIAASWWSRVGRAMSTASS